MSSAAISGPPLSNGGVAHPCSGRWQGTFTVGFGMLASLSRGDFPRKNRYMPSIPTTTLADVRGQMVVKCIPARLLTHTIRAKRVGP